MPVASHNTWQSVSRCRAGSCFCKEFVSVMVATPLRIRNDAHHTHRELTGSHISSCKSWLRRPVPSIGYLQKKHKRNQLDSQHFQPRQMPNTGLGLSLVIAHYIAKFKINNELDIFPEYTSQIYPHGLHSRSTHLRVSGSIG